jgi:20S proteasome alpha/beta subunit
MTLGVGIETNGGIVVVSDSRATVGDLRGLTTNNDTHMKIFTPTPMVALALAGSGDVGHALMQHVRAQLDQTNSDVDAVAGSMKVMGAQYYAQSFGVPQWMMSPSGAPVSTPRPDVWCLLAGYTLAGQPKLINMTSAVPFNFTPSFTNTGFAAVGVAPLALYLLNRLYRRHLSLEIAKDLAAYCIEETASQDGKVGGAVRMAIVRHNLPTEIIGDDEIAELSRRVGVHREALKQSFLTLPRELQALPAVNAEGAPKLAPAK